MQRYFPAYLAFLAALGTPMECEGGDVPKKAVLISKIEVDQTELIYMSVLL